MRISLADDGRLDLDLSCRNCGYSLRGLLPQGVCPECGHAVGDSIREHFLAHADHDWLRRVARGARLFGAGVLIVLASPVLALACGSPLVAMVDSLAGGGSFAGDIIRIALALVYAGLVCATVGRGSFDATAPEPAHRASRAAAAARTTARLSLMVACAACILAVAVVLMSLAGLYNKQPVMILLCVGGGSGGVGTIALLHYLSMLAHRVPDPALLSETRITAWLATCSGLLLGLSIAWLAIWASTPGGLLQVPLAMLGISLVGILASMAVTAGVTQSVAKSLQLLADGGPSAIPG